MELEKLAEIINESFGPPFLPEGFVKAEMTEGGRLWLTIGPRDIELDKDLRRLSSGTWLTEKWFIEKAQIEVQEEVFRQDGLTAAVIES